MWYSQVIQPSQRPDVVTCAGTCYKQTCEAQQAQFTSEDLFMRSFKRARGNRRTSQDSNTSSTNADMGFDVLKGQADSDDYQEVSLQQHHTYTLC